MPNEDFIYEHLRALLEERRYLDLSRVLQRMDPADTADFLENIEPEQRETLFALLDPETASEVLVELGDSYVDDVVEDMGARRIAKLADEMAVDDAAHFIAGLELNTDRQTRVLDSMSEPDEVRGLLRHQEDTAGHIMTTELCALPRHATVKEARETLVPMEVTDPILFVYVTEADSGELRGVISLKDLFTASPQARLEDIADRDYVSCLIDEDQEDVARKFRKYDIWVMPVVDHDNRLVGRITADDIMDVLHEEADEDLARMVGAPDIEIETASPLIVARLRLPWLLITMFAGLLNSLIINTILNVTGIVTIAIFVPAIMAMGGNTGIQSSAIAIRGIALGHQAYGRLLKTVGREIVVGIFMGLSCGSITAAIVWGVLSYFPSDTGAYAPLTLALTVGSAMCNAMVFAACYGSVVPIILNRLGIDPAVASGPFVTTSNDLSASMIYFGTCVVLLL